ncbi:ComEA family DNA-binding protein [Streptomyces sp. NPDC046853]|uniref:ComEA family DNA-binding protein n=1 Tax=Streptomyces sp. NPDC046853 TaxID=3154920 RepID=UPI0033D45906
MTLRSLSRTPAATSGPGRGPASDGRVSGGRSSDGRASDGRERYRRARRRAARRRHTSGEAREPALALRQRAESLFAEPVRADGGGELRSGAPPDAGGVRGAPPQLRSEEPAQAPVRSGVDGGERAAPPVRGRVGLAVRERLPLWLQTRCGLERRSLVALVVVIALAGVFAAQHFWAGRTQSVRAPEVVGAASGRGAEPSASPGAPPSPGSGGQSAAGAGGVPGASGASGAGGGEVVVDVSGKVRSPGMLRLPAGSRVADALKAAGGVRPGADTAGLNRARLLVDGEQVAVGEPAAASAAPAVPAAPGAGAAAGPPGASPAAQVGLNTATAEQLDELPGVGPVLAQHIIDYRTEHGGFRSVDELREVNGIGDKRYADLQNLVRP